MFELITGWFLDKAIFSIIAIILGVGVVAVYTDWICLLLVNLGGLITTVGLVFKDKKLTKEEVSEIKAKFAELRSSIKSIPRGKKNG